MHPWSCCDKDGYAVEAIENVEIDEDNDEDKDEDNDEDNDEDDGMNDLIKAEVVKAILSAYTAVQG